MADPTASAVLQAHGFARSMHPLWLTPDGLRIVSEHDALQMIDTGTVPTPAEYRITGVNTDE